MQEREIQDLQREFQAERADYLDSIRKSEQSVRFYQQLLDRALPVLRRDNRFWDLDDIRSKSDWSDDSKKWTFPEESLRRVALPRTVTQSLPPSPNVVGDEDQPAREEDGADLLIRKLQKGDSQTIVESYFRPKRARELLRMSNSGGTGSGRRESRNSIMLNKVLMGTSERTIMPTNHSNFTMFAAKLKNI